MKQIIIILCLFFSLSSAGAQSWQLFNMLVKQGNYSDAKKILVVLDNVDPKTMSSVNACIKLQEEAVFSSKEPQEDNKGHLALFHRRTYIHNQDLL